jgi:hypothetical protein
MRNGRTPFTLLPLFLLLFALLTAANPVQAQSYSFAVPELRMQVFVQPDASVKIIYDIIFQNNPGAQTIDIIDIGTPHDNYDLSTFSATMNGRPVADIRDSEVIKTGVEIHLGSETLSSGESGTLHVEFTMPDLVYEDTTQDGYASLEITPTWFDPSLVTGLSDIWVVMHMLPEVTAEEVLYQDVAFTDKIMFEEHVVAAWRWQNGQATQPYLVGASFPDRGMTRVIEQSLFDLIQKWLTDNPWVGVLLGIGTFLLLTIAFFRFTGGTGFSVFALIACGLIWAAYTSPTILLLACPAALALFGFVEFKMAGRKNTYLPAIAQVEGGGIKRGLTAPEAAILLELPLNKVLLLIIFGLLDKGAIELTDDTPLTVKLTTAYVSASASSQKRREERQEMAKQAGIVLRGYEHAILDILQDNPNLPVHKQDLSDPMDAMIRSVVGRMKGFDLSDTQDYYKKIIAQAMAQAKSMGDIPQLEEHLDKTWPWIFLDDDYDRTMRRRDYEYFPRWSRPYVVTHGAGGSISSPTPSQSGPAYGGKTTFGDVAASFAGWTENTAGKMADAISPSALNIKTSSGVVNLSGADRITGDVFKALTTSSGGSGGSSGGGGCACACAGCACACACAGGGR